MPAKGIYLAIAGGGAIFLWSGLKGKNWSTVLRNLVSGRNPVTGQTANPIGGSSTSGSGTSGISVPSSQSETAWISALLKSLGAPVNAANTDSISSWIRRETSWPPVAANNPLNTTLPMSGATNYNSTGVKNYPTAQEGMQATVQTLEGYPEILNRLRTGQGLCGWSSEEFDTWSDNGYNQVC